MQTVHPLGNRTPLLGLSGGLNPMSLSLHRSLMSRYVLRPLTTFQRFPLANRLSLLQLPKLSLQASPYQSLNLTEWTEEPNESIPQTHIEPKIDLVELSEEPDESVSQPWSDSIVETVEQSYTDQASLPESLEVQFNEAVVETAIASENESEKTENSIEPMPKKQNSRIRKTRKAKSSESKKSLIQAEKKTSTQTKKTSTRTKRSAKKTVPAQSEVFQPESVQALEQNVLRKPEDALNSTDIVDASENFTVVAESIAPTYQEQVSPEETPESFELESPNPKADPISEAVMKPDLVQEENVIDRTTKTTQKLAEAELQRTAEPLTIPEQSPPVASEVLDERSAIPVQPSLSVPELPEDHALSEQSSLEIFLASQIDESPSEILRATIESSIVPEPERSTQQDVEQSIIEPETQTSAESETIIAPTPELDEPAIAASSRIPQLESLHSEHSQFNPLEPIAIDDVVPQLDTPFDRIVNQIQEPALINEDTELPTLQTVVQPTPNLPQEESQPHALLHEEKAAIHSVAQPTSNPLQEERQPHALLHEEEAAIYSTGESRPEASNIQSATSSEISEQLNQETEPVEVDRSSEIEPFEQLDPIVSELFSEVDVPIQGYAIGGVVTETISPSTIDPSDTVPAMLTPGEFVINVNAAQKHLPLLRHLNQGGTIDHSDTIPKTVDSSTIKQGRSDQSLSRAASNSLIQLSSIQSGAFEQFETSNSDSRSDYTYTSPNFIFRSPAPSRSSPSASNPDQWNSIEELLTFSNESFSTVSTQAASTQSASMVQRRSIQGFAEGGEVMSPPEPLDVSETNSPEAGSSDESEPSTSAIDTLAQEIYQRLRQRLEIERERCGLYSGRLPW